MEPFRAHASSATFRVARGFTLIELLVVLAIIGVILGVVFSSQGSFNRTLVLANTAYDIALTFRNAETYGITSRGSGSNANIGYGLHFDRTTPAAFIFFSDSNAPDVSSCHGLPVGGATAPNAKPGNCKYDAPGEYLSTYNLNNQSTVTDFCALQGTSWFCAHSHGSTLTWLDVVFSRPDATPFISTSAAGYSPLYTQACLSISAPGAATTHYVSVTTSGEINPTASCCGAACP